VKRFRGFSSRRFHSLHCLDIVSLPVVLFKPIYQLFDLLVISLMEEIALWLHLNIFFNKNILWNITKYNMLRIARKNSQLIRDAIRFFSFFFLENIFKLFNSITIWEELYTIGSLTHELIAWDDVPCYYLFKILEKVFSADLKFSAN